MIRHDELRSRTVRPASPDGTGKRIKISRFAPIFVDAQDGQAADHLGLDDDQSVDGDEHEERDRQDGEGPTSHAGANGHRATLGSLQRKPGCSLQNEHGQTEQAAQQREGRDEAKQRNADVVAVGVHRNARVHVADGDVAASILTCMPDSEVDVLYGIGGAPEGVVSAAVIRALDGDMQGRLLARHHVKGDNEENRRIGENELARCKTMGIEAGKVLRLDEMARSDNVVFSATGITKGDLLDGITRKGNMATTETLLIRGKSRTIRRIQSIHYLDRKDPDIQQHIL